MRANIIKSLAPHRPTELLAVALEIAGQMSQEHDRANALVALIPHLDAILIENVYNLALQIQDEYDRAEVLFSLVPRLSAQLLPGALQASQQISNLSAQGLALVAFAKILPGKQGREVVEQAYAAAMQGKNLAARARILSLLAPILSQKQRAQTLKSVNQITNEIERAGLLSTLSHYLTNGEFKQPIQIAQQLRFSAWGVNRTAYPSSRRRGLRWDTNGPPRVNPSSPAEIIENNCRRSTGDDRPRCSRPHYLKIAELMPLEMPVLKS